MQDKIILGILNLLGQRSGYDLKKYMERSTEHFYNSSLGSINPALKKLTQNGWARFEEKIENGRAKKIYNITDEGRKIFKNWLAEEATKGKIKDDFLLKIFFFADLSRDERIEVVTNYIQLLNEQIVSLKKIRSELDLDGLPMEYREVGFFQSSTLDFGIDYYQFISDWYQNFLHRI